MIVSKLIFKNMGEKGSAKGASLCWPEYMSLFSAIGITHPYRPDRPVINLTSDLFKTT